jgi:hypothetical protein
VFGIEERLTIFLLFLYACCSEQKNYEYFKYSTRIVLYKTHSLPQKKIGPVTFKFSVVPYQIPSTLKDVLIRTLQVY